jgi:hypothetical protein
MTLPFIREFRLGGSHGDGLHPYVNLDGAFLGRGVPILEEDESGRWRARPRSTLEKLFRVGYGVPVDLGWRITQLGYVAQALNKRDLCLANISLVRMELPPLPNDDHARAMAKADGLLIKGNPDWEDEPRIPAGNPGGGQWTTGGETGGDANRVHLPPGQRIDELQDLAEWIANAKPEDEAKIRNEIKRLYYEVGDTRGGDALNRALSDALEAGDNLEERQQILNSIDAYTQADPREMAGIEQGLVAGALAGATEEVPSPTLRPGQTVWDLPPVKRGNAIDAALGGNTPTNYPVVDIWEDNIATSIKSVDLNAATYQNMSNLASNLNRSMNQLADFNGTTFNELTIEADQIEGRVLDVVVPKGSLTDAQRAVFDQARIRASQLGVKLTITEY